MSATRFDSTARYRFRPRCERDVRSFSKPPEQIRDGFPDVVPLNAMDGVQAWPRFRWRIADEFSAACWSGSTHRMCSQPADRSFMSALSRIAAEAFERARLFDAERSARTAAESANRAKAAFLASMSHELRTPLQAALGFAQLLRSGSVRTDQRGTERRALARVERSQTHLARLIDDILDFARLEAGRVRVMLEAVPVSRDHRRPDAARRAAGGAQEDLAQRAGGPTASSSPSIGSACDRS